MLVRTRFCVPFGHVWNGTLNSRSVVSRLVRRRRPTSPDSELDFHRDSGRYVCAQHVYNDYYRSAPGKPPWALKHNLRFWPTWALTWDYSIVYVCTHRSYYSRVRVTTVEWEWYVCTKYQEWNNNWSLTKDTPYLWHNTISLCVTFNKMLQSIPLKGNPPY